MEATKPKLTIHEVAKILQVIKEKHPEVYRHLVGLIKAVLK